MQLGRYFIGCKCPCDLVDIAWVAKVLVARSRAPSGLIPDLLVENGGMKGAVLPELITVDDIHDSRIEAFVSLTNVQLRSRLEPEKGLFIAEGEKVITRALQAGYEPISFLLEEKWIPSMGQVFACVDQNFSGTPIYVANHEDIEGIAGYEVTRGALAAFRRKPELSLNEVLQDGRRFVALEAITNASNVGAIFRTAAALGIDGVLMDDTCCDPLYRRALRVSMGCALFIPWARFGRADCYGTLFDELHSRGFTTCALALTSEAKSLRDVDLSGFEKAVMFFGTEGEGLSQDVISRCDFAVEIPMTEEVDSLNVVGASAIACWELSKTA